MQLKAQSSRPNAVPRGGLLRLRRAVPALLVQLRELSADLAAPSTQTWITAAAVGMAIALALAVALAIG